MKKILLIILGVLLLPIAIAFNGVIRDTTSSLNIINSTHINIEDSGTNISYFHVNTTNVYAGAYYFLGTEFTLWLSTRYVNSSWTNVTYDSEIVSHVGNWTNDKHWYINGSSNQTWVVTQVGNWSADKSSYPTDSNLATNITNLNESVKLWVYNGTLDNTFNSTIEIWAAISNQTWDEKIVTINETMLNKTTAFGGEVSGTFDNIVLDNDALDDQYYDAESDLTGLLDDNYVDVAGDTMTGNLVIQGNLTILGDEVIANVTTQNLNGSFLPQLNNQFDIGSPTLRWNEIYATILDGSLGYKNLTDYPSDCTNQFVRGLDDTLTCASVDSADIATDAVKDDEIDYTAVTLADITDDVGYCLDTELATNISSLNASVKLWVYNGTFYTKTETNTTIDTKLAGNVWFFIVNYTLYGTPVGYLNGTQQSNNFDNDGLNITEVAVNGLEYYANTSNNVTSDVNKICIRYKADGDDYEVSLRKTDDTWVKEMTLTSVDEFKNDCKDIIDSSNFIVDNKVFIKIVHTGQANTQHKLYLDAMYVLSGYTPRVGNEVDPIAVHRDGDKPLTDDWDVGGFSFVNVTSINGTNSVLRVTDTIVAIYLNGTWNGSVDYALTTDINAWISSNKTDTETVLRNNIDTNVTELNGQVLNTSNVGGHNISFDANGKLAINMTIPIDTDTFNSTKDVQNAINSTGGLYYNLTASNLLAYIDIDIGSFDFQAQTMTIDVAAGTSPFTITSTTMVPKLNTSFANLSYISYDLQCTNCIGGTEIAELADADISNTLTCSDLVAAGDVDIGAHELRAQTLESDVATGTAPFTITSATQVANLNVTAADTAYYLYADVNLEINDYDINGVNCINFTNGAAICES